MPFKPGFIKSPTVSAQTLWFVFHKDKLLLRETDNGLRVPDTGALTRMKLAPARSQYLGTLNNRACIAAEMPDKNQATCGWDLIGLRETFGRLEEELIWVAGRANQLVDWSRSHQYCGQCGHRTRDQSDERAKICPACGLVNYPRLSPAVIVAVVRDDCLLLASNKRFRPGFYSVLAGFVEPGETLEECVAREIKEEVGICVKNIRYFGSQPWPFPNSLMVAFSAEYAGGEISADPSEILEAGWFTPDNLPSIPPKITIARHLID